MLYTNSRSAHNSTRMARKYLAYLEGYGRELEAYKNNHIRLVQEISPENAVRCQESWETLNGIFRKRRIPESAWGSIKDYLENEAIELQPGEPRVSFASVLSADQEAILSAKEDMLDAAMRQRKGQLIATAFDAVTCAGIDTLGYQDAILSQDEKKATAIREKMDEVLIKELDYWHVERLPLYEFLEKTALESLKIQRSVQPAEESQREAVVNRLRVSKGGTKEWGTEQWFRMHRLDDKVKSLPDAPGLRTSYIDAVRQGNARALTGLWHGLEESMQRADIDPDLAACYRPYLTAVAMRVAPKSPGERISTTASNHRAR